ncbi:kelch repeat-containing F-box family protein [Arabidopsis lyrata subsp. lyrata]|uniref:Kelch repeat-containing F-box family protein n=1 Tax=Arabidopsis lyrata subsp. lyrata TaxID=81972 RepID=D7MVV0_ARALL|nr:F-box/kelch-repeat protein At5g48990 [Arabidopsis lyrata subsp. lyrata]EFH39331.1 kelch repeat-containing F-box family protein [Arabidopsis lyrata subsp. lyrata]|eukprot:XP_002863072.1 F-box/kelch-repeat protein At5g48990 [Arabidopsis lyrata subsp. lyrata]
MSSPEKKRKSPTRKTKKRSLTPSPESTSNPSLPDDLVVNILARVSRSYHPNLSLVCKSFRSILASPELYQTRTLLGKTETFLYVCLRFPDEANPRWFTLYRKPNQNLTKKKKKKKKKKEDSSVNLLAPTPILNSPHVEWARLIAVGSNLYAITAAIEDSPCSNVWYLDCRTHTWLEAPRMRIAHTNSELDKNVYLAGSSENPYSLNCVEVYNTKTQTWNPVPPQKRKFKFGNMEGKIYMNPVRENPRKVVALKPKVMTWEAVGWDTDLDRGSICMMENIAYCYDPSEKFSWIKFNTDEDWRRLEGLEGLPKFARYSTVKLADYGGKLVVFWDKYVAATGYKEKMIWCAEISLEKRNSEEIWGKVEWFDAVLTVPKSYKFVCAKSATV